MLIWHYYLEEELKPTILHLYLFILPQSFILMFMDIYIYMDIWIFQFQYKLILFAKATM